MNISEWASIATPSQKKALIESCKTSRGYLDQLSGGHRRPGNKMSRKLVSASKQITPDFPMTLIALRPDIWGETA